MQRSMARLKLVSRWFSNRFDVVDAVGRRVGTIDSKRMCNDVKLTIKGASYIIENRETNVALAHHGHDTARASFAETTPDGPRDEPQKSISIEHGNRVFALETRAAGLFGAAKYIARERGRIVGTVKSHVVDLPETVPLHIRVFMAWLVATADRPEATA